jgi:hypothetical protein
LVKKGFKNGSKSGHLGHFEGVSRAFVHRYGAGSLAGLVNLHSEHSEPEDPALMGPTLAKVDPLVVKLSRRVFGGSRTSNHI